MGNPTRAEAIKYLLDKRARPHLAALYHAGLEAQVNVAKDEGELKDGFSGKKRGRTYTTGQETWYDFRIPHNAWNDPEDNSNKEMTYSLLDRADAVGLTGWCFSDLRSIWFAYDFDAIVGHSVRHTKKMDDAELRRVQDAACSIPWVQVQKSTSGSGLHLYVFLEMPEPTKNHDEHAALGRAVLSQMSAIVGYDFESKVDVCGSNIWVWARRMKNTDGLTIVKAATEKLKEVPKNWRTHLHVVKGARKKILPEFAEGDPKEFDELAGQRQRVTLDDSHKALIADLRDHQCCGWWDSDHHMLVTHTKHLEAAHSRLGMRGPFKTTSDGTELDNPNCWCFPHADGAWVIRRYTKGTSEDPSWEQGPNTWTRCWLNREPDLRTASKAKGGIENENGAFHFNEAGIAAEVIRSLGGAVEVPAALEVRGAKVKPHKDGKKIIIEVERDTKDRPDQMLGWYEEKGKWKKVVSADPRLGSEAEVGALDDELRHVTSESGTDAGWFIRVKNGWNHEPIGNVQKVLSHIGYKKVEADPLMGASIRNPWTLVSRPFQDEYPGDRLWNRSRAKYRYPKVEDYGPFPTWEKLYEHCGRGLNDALAIDGWAQSNDVKTGKAYLMLWTASLLQDPYSPLPYLFFWSEEQDTGKSSFHESMDLLIDGGITEANLIFNKDERFNPQMEGAVLCYLEEVDLNSNKKAYEQIKNWVTSRYVTIRKMYIDPYQMLNTSHWVHMANDPRACPIFTGDTRITMLHVPTLDPKEMIPKPELMDQLKKEAPHFLSYLLSLDIPASGSRLKLPVMNTSEKDVLARQNKNMLQEFIDTKCFQVPGEHVLFADFYDKFQETLDPGDKIEWSSRNAVSRRIPPQFPKGKIGADSAIGNLSFSPAQGPAKRKLVENADGKLVSS